MVVSTTNCYDKCCHLAWENIENRRHVSCIAIIDPVNKEQWLIDATQILNIS